MTISQYFVYKRPIAWTLLVATLAAGYAAYRAMPQRQDPVIQIRSGLVMTVYPGADATEVEQEVSRRIERKLAENPAVPRLRDELQGHEIVTLLHSVHDAEHNHAVLLRDELLTLGTSAA